MSHKLEPLDVGHSIHSKILLASYLRTSTIKQVGTGVGASVVIAWYGSSC